VELKEAALRAAEVAWEKKGEDVVVVNVGELLVVVDYFVIATAVNDRQVRAIVDSVEDALREEAGIKPIGREGLDEGRWALLDYGDLVVHIFQPEARDFYRLDNLWGDAPITRLDPDLGLSVS